MPRPLGNITVTVVTPTQTVNTRDNTTEIGFASPTLTSVTGCMMEPFLMADKLQFEVTGERDYSKSTWRIWAPGVAVILALRPHDRIRILGVEYEVFGHEGTWYNFDGSIHHCQFIVQVREG